MARQKQADIDENKMLLDYLTTQNQETLSELRTMATTYYCYYAVLRQTGFTRDAAMQLVVAMQTRFLAHAQEANDG